MQFNKVAVLAGLVGLVVGANNSTLTTATPEVSSQCSFSDFTATNVQDIQEVAACPTAVGDILIQGAGIGAIELTGVKAIYGDLIVDNAIEVVSINAPTLELISGSFEITNATILSSLNLAQLTTVGSLQFVTLPALDTIGLVAGITSAESVIISDTKITSLNGINVFKLETFNINNNGEIDVINSGLQEVTDLLSISDNNEKVDVNLDQLSSAKNVLLAKIGSLSATNLTTVNGSLSVTNSNVGSIDLSELTAIGSALTIDRNDNLTEIDFPILKSIGGALEIGDNSELEDFGGFPKLETVGGTVNLTGSFNNGSFDSLTRVAGGFILNSQDGELSCSDFDQLNSDGVIKGDQYSCAGADGTSSSSSSKAGNSNGTSAPSSGSSGSSGSNSSSSNVGATAAPTGKLAALIAVFAAFGVALY